MRFRTFPLALACVAMLAGVSARADFNPIAQPNAAYTSSTTLIDISGIPDGTTGITSVTDGIQTVSFDQSLEKGTSGSSGWATWNSPPAVETNTPPVLFRLSTNSLTLSLSVLSTTFGFELQGNVQTVSSQFLVTFLDNALNPVGNVNLLVNGDAGALLFAASTTTSPFSRVTIDNTSLNADGFAIANLRYTAVPEPASIAMVAQAVVAVGFYGWRKRRQMNAEV
jgi:hypothetical protein